MAANGPAFLQDVPWLVPALLWVGGSLLLWALISPFAHVAAGLVETLRAGVRAGIDALQRRIRDAREQRAGEVTSFRKRAIASGAIQDLDAAGSTIWQETITKLIRPLEHFSSQLTDTDTKVRNAAQAIDHVLNTAAKLDDESLKDLKFSVEDLKPAEHIAARKAKINLIIATLLLACIVIVNTAMLSQILRDADIIPSNIRIGTLQLYWIFALMLTLFETGIGLAHGFFTAQAEETKRGPALAGVLMLLLAFGIAFVEGYFYSRIGANRTEAFTVPFLDRTMNPEQIFFGWGFALVTGLFAFGTMFYRSLMTMIHAKTIQAIAKELRAFQAQIGTITNSLAQHADTLKAKVQEALEAHAKVGQMTPQERRTIQDVAAELRSELLSWRQAPPAWAEHAGGEAAEGHWDRLQTRAAFVLWFTVLLVAALGRLFLGAIVGNGFLAPAQLFAGIGLALAFPLAGLLLRPTRGPSNDRPRLQDFYNANGLIFLIVIVGISIISLQKLWAGETAAAVMALCAGALLVFCGYELAHLMSFVGAHVLALWHRFVNMIGVLLQALLWLVYGLLTILSAVLGFCAAPLRLVLRRRTAAQPV